MKKALFLGILAMFLLSGCAGKSKWAQLGDIPVEPVTTPELYRFGPAKGTLESNWKVKIGDEETVGSMSIKYNVISEQDRLIWHAWIPEWEHKGKRYVPHLPLMNLSFDSDFRGDTDNFEMTFPLVKAMGITAPELLEKFDKLATTFIEGYNPLPQNAIKTGDLLASLKMPNWEVYFVGEAPKLPAILEGEIVQDGVHYVVTSMKTSFPAKLKDTNFTLYVDYTYRGIIRKDNMETVYEVHLMEGANAMKQKLIGIETTYEKTE